MSVTSCYQSALPYLGLSQSWLATCQLLYHFIYPYFCSQKIILVMNNVKTLYCHIIIFYLYFAMWLYKSLILFTFVFLPSSSWVYALVLFLVFLSSKFVIPFSCCILFHLYLFTPCDFSHEHYVCKLWKKNISHNYFLL